MPAKTYSLDEVVVTINGRRVRELATGDAIAIAFTEDDWSTQQGFGDSVVFSRKANSVAEVTLRVMQGSPENQWLSDLANADRISGRGAFDFVVQDARARRTFVSGRGRVKKRPDVTFADEAGAVEWALLIANVTHKMGTQDGA